MLNRRYIVLLFLLAFGCTKIDLESDEFGQSYYQIEENIEKNKNTVIKISKNTQDFDNKYETNIQDSENQENLNTQKTINQNPENTQDSNDINIQDSENQDNLNIQKTMNQNPENEIKKIITNNENEYDSNSEIILTFEINKNDLSYNNNTSALDFLISKIKSSDFVLIYATTSSNESDEIYSKRITSVKEYLAKKIAIERIIVAKNRSYESEDDLYSVVCSIN